MINIFSVIGMLFIAAVLLYAGWIRALGRLSDHFYDESSVRCMRISGMRQRKWLRRTESFKYVEP